MHVRIHYYSTATQAPGPVRHRRPGPHARVQGKDVARAHGPDLTGRGGAIRDSRTAASSPRHVRRRAWRYFWRRGTPRIKITTRARGAPMLVASPGAREPHVPRRQRWRPRWPSGSPPDWLVGSGVQQQLVCGRRQLGCAGRRPST